MNHLENIFLSIIFFCWGSFLNSLAYRLVVQNSLSKFRSACVLCKQIIKWYDLIPVFSWIILKGKCRNCVKPISLLYPLIEIITLIIFTTGYFYLNSQYYFASFIFFSALIVTIRTDFEFMLISRFASLYLVPVGIFLSSLNLTWVSAKESIFASLSAYVFMFLINYIFKFIRKKDGIGEGDFELLAMIGSFIGFKGFWISLTLGSFFATIFGLLCQIFFKGKPNDKAPFGPWLALGAILFVFYNEKFLIII